MSAKMSGAERGRAVDTTIDLEALGVELARLDRDARTALRIADVHLVLAGRRLIAIRDALGPARWAAWLTNHCPLKKAVVAECIRRARRWRESG